MSTALDMKRAQDAYTKSLDFAVDDLVGDLSASLRRGTGKIQRAFSRFLDGLETGPGGFILDTADNRALLNALRQKIDAEMQLNLLARGRNLTKRAVRRTHRAGRVRVIDTRPGVKAAISTTDARQISSYTRLLHKSLAQLDVDTANHVTHTLTRSALEGWSPRQVADALVEGGQLKAGPVHTVETRAELIARTEPRRVAEEAHVARHKDATGEDNPFGQWIAIIDRRTGPDSKRRHGKVLRLSQWRTKKIPGDDLTGLPPIRPNDRCSIQWLQKSDWTPEEWAAIKSGKLFYQVAA